MYVNRMTYGTRRRGGVQAILGDGNTVAWFDFAENITKNADNILSDWGDKSGNGNDLPQSNSAWRPKWSANGVLFNGDNEFLKSAPFTLFKPTYAYILFRQVSFIDLSHVFDGNTSSSSQIFQHDDAPNLNMYAGTAMGKNANLAMNTFGVVRALFNGASSKFIIDETTPITGDAGAGDFGGFTLARTGGTGSGHANIEVKEVILRKIADTDEDSLSIYNYLSTKKGVLPVIGILGDSISHSTSPAWPINIPSTYVVNNHAVTGQSIITNMDFQTAEAAYDNNDIMVLALGTNDDNGGDMGALQAEVEENIAELKLSNLYTTIYYMNVLPRWTDSGGGTPIDKSNIRTAIEDACAAESITCWDTFTDPWIEASDTSDGTHPTLAGGVIVWDEIVARI